MASPERWPPIGEIPVCIFDDPDLEISFGADDVVLVRHRRDDEIVIDEYKDGERLQSRIERPDSQRRPHGHSATAPGKNAVYQNRRPGAALGARGSGSGLESVAG